MVSESERPITHVARDLGINSEVLRKPIRQLEAVEPLLSTTSVKS